MKHKFALALSILALLSPIISVKVMLNIEPEVAEAIASGILVGCAIGSIFGIISLILNNGKRKPVTVLSIIPMCPLVLYLLLLIPYMSFK